MFFLIDPIIQLEFLRGEYKNDIYQKKSDFLKYELFSLMTDHQQIYAKIRNNAIMIGRIHAQNKQKDVPLGDLLITARLMEYTSSCLFLTEDHNDFPTTLFDRCAVISIEKKGKQNTGLVIEHMYLLQFNMEKYTKCVDNLPK